MPLFSILFVLCMLEAMLVGGIELYYMDQFCGSSLELTYPRQIYSVRLQLTKESYYTTDRNCIIHLHADRNEKLLLYFKSMDFNDDCSESWLELFDGDSTDDHYVPGLHGRQCGGMKLWKDYHTNTNTLTVYFSGARYRHHSNFDMIITRYQNGHCNNDEYRCGKGWCINNSLKCQDYNPCGSDSGCSMPAASIVALVIGCLAFVVIVVVCFVFIRRHRKKYVERIVTVETPPPTYGSHGDSYNQPVPKQFQAPPPVQYQGGYESIPSAPPPPYSKE